MKLEDEKRYLYEMMKNITEERRKLTDIYYGLKKRLDELNNLEIRGLDELNLKGYIDLHSESDKKTSIENIKRESEEAIKRVLKKDDESQKNISVIPPDEIDRVKQIDKIGKVKINKNKKKSTQLPLKDVVPVIESVLKDSGVPLRTEKIRIEVEKILERKIDKGNFQRNVLPRAIKKSEKIGRATKGYYQYVRR